LLDVGGLSFIPHPQVFECVAGKIFRSDSKYITGHLASRGQRIAGEPDHGIFPRISTPEIFAQYFFMVQSDCKDIYPRVDRNAHEFIYLPELRSTD
jgi:hypothetical protein